MTRAERVILVCNEKEGGKMSTFARRTGVTPAYISKLKNKPDSEPSTIFIKEVCRQYQVNETWLLTGEGSMHSPPSDEARIAEIVRDLRINSEPVKNALIMGIQKCNEQSLQEVLTVILKELHEHGVDLHFED